MTCRLRTLTFNPLRPETRDTRVVAHDPWPAIRHSSLWPATYDPLPTTEACDPRTVTPTRDPPKQPATRDPWPAPVAYDPGPANSDQPPVTRTKNKNYLRPSDMKIKENFAWDGGLIR